MSKLTVLLSAVVLSASALAGCGGPDESDAAQDLGALSPDACGKDTWKNYAGKFFKNDCASCHASAFSTDAAVVASGAKAQIAAGRMPRDKALTASQKKRILNWFACGSP